MAQTPQPHYQNPHPGSPDYQQQVATSIQALVSGARPRDPAMSGASTGRLILEAVVESLKIYRGYKQDVARGTREKEDCSRQRERRGARGEGFRARDGERRRRRVRYGSDGYGDGRGRRHSGGKGEREGRGQNRSQSRKGREQCQLDQSQQKRILRGQESEPEPRSSSAQPVMSGALHIAQDIAGQRFGPDGTPFGTLPSRTKGVGITGACNDCVSTRQS